MKVVGLTGACISAGSGVPTFRDANGLGEGHRVEEVATPEAFDLQPSAVHRFTTSAAPRWAASARTTRTARWPGSRASSATTSW